MSRPETEGRPEGLAEGLLAGIPRQPSPPDLPPSPPPEPASPPPRRFDPAGRVADALVDGFVVFTGRTLGRYQAAVVRIGFALVFTLQLLREWPNRRELYGDLSPWSLQLARRLLDQTQAFTVLSWQDGRWWFEAGYLLAILSGVLLALGWRTRLSSVLFLVSVFSVQNRDVLIGDGGDNIVHLMAGYLVLTRCGAVWSLDARRRARRGRDAGSGGSSEGFGVLLWALLGGLLTAAQLAGRVSWGGDGWPYLGWASFFWALWGCAGLWYVVNRWWPRGEPRAVLDALATMLHNCAMLVIAAQVVLVYATAGWYKVQGPHWQDGTALYYPLHLDYFTPWPGLSALLGASAVAVFLLSYGTVMVQVAFPFTLFNRRLKNVLLALMITEHLAIAVVLGLPLFSLAMVSADAVFLPTAALLRVGGLVSRETWRAERG